MAKVDSFHTTFPYQEKRMEWNIFCQDDSEVFKNVIDKLLSHFVF